MYLAGLLVKYLGIQLISFVEVCFVLLKEYL